jgi:hypothetical protein
MAFSEGMPASRLVAATLAISALAKQLANLSVSPAIAEVAIEPASNIAATAAGRFAAPSPPTFIMHAGRRRARTESESISTFKGHRDRIFRNCLVRLTFNRYPFQLPCRISKIPYAVVLRRSVIPESDRPGTPLEAHLIFGLNELT